MVIFYFQWSFSKQGLENSFLCFLHFPFKMRKFWCKMRIEILHYPNRDNRSRFVGFSRKSELQWKREQSCQCLVFLPRPVRDRRPVAIPCFSKTPSLLRRASFPCLRSRSDSLQKFNSSMSLISVVGSFRGLSLIGFCDSFNGNRALELKRTSEAVPRYYSSVELLLLREFFCIK